MTLHVVMIHGWKAIKQLWPTKEWTNKIHMHEMTSLFLRTGCVYLIQYNAIPINRCAKMPLDML